MVNSRAGRKSTSVESKTDWARLKFGVGDAQSVNFGGAGRPR